MCYRDRKDTNEKISSEVEAKSRACKQGAVASESTAADLRTGTVGAGECMSVRRGYQREARVADDPAQSRKEAVQVRSSARGLVAVTHMSGEWRAPGSSSSGAGPAPSTAAYSGGSTLCA